MDTQLSDDLRIGRIVSLNGSQVIALLRAKVKGEDGSANLQIGGLVKMRTVETVVFAIVSGLSIPMPSQDNTAGELRISELELIGEVPITDGVYGEFRRGISASPGLTDDVFQTSVDDLRLVYARPAATTIEMGTIHQESSLPAFCVVDDLLGKHFAVLGTTGTGKSCAVSLILHKILEQHQNAHIVLLDPHGEYAAAFGELAETIEPGDLQLPHWMFNFEEFVEIVFGGDADKLITEVGLLRDIVQQAKVQFLGDLADEFVVTVDTPVPYKIGDINTLIGEELGRLENRRDNIAPLQRVRARLNALQGDRRYSFMFQGSVVVRDNMAAILSRIFRIPVNGKPIAIINLSGVPSEILNVVVSVLCRMTFDFAVWGDASTPILLICEEAHRYAPASIEDGFAPAKRALSRIAKEGRKYGVSLGVISQRPSELDASMLSQCNTVFAMRMSSQRDQDYVKAAMTEVAQGLIDSLPSLGNAEAIAVGEGVAVPMRVSFSQLPPHQRPRSGTAEFSSSWQEGGDTDASLQAVIDRWRRQRR